MLCTKPICLTNNIDRSKFPDGLLVPCGRCFACRIQKRKEWSMRMFHELGYHNNNSFVTLTYSEDYLPAEYSLKKNDLQKFFKRLRKSLPSEYKIKYFACGEYGDITYRPHYHMILFGLGLNDIDRDYVKRAWPFCDWSVPDIANNSFGLAEAQSIEYVAGYINKKLSGYEEDYVYTKSGRENVFKLASNGIGKQYALDNAVQIKQTNALTHRGIKHALPRYYCDLLNIDTDSMRVSAQLADAEKVGDYIGIYNSFDDLYRAGVNLTDYVLRDKSIKNQRDKNLKAKSSLKKRDTTQKYTDK